MSSNLEAGTRRRKTLLTFSGLTKAEKAKLHSVGVTEHGQFIGKEKARGPVRPAVAALNHAHDAKVYAQHEKYSDVVKDLKAVKNAETRVAEKATSAYVHDAAKSAEHAAVNAIKKAKSKTFGSPQRKKLETKNKVARVVRSADKVVTAVVHDVARVHLGTSATARGARKNARADAKRRKVEHSEERKEKSPRRSSPKRKSPKVSRGPVGEVVKTVTDPVLNLADQALSAFTKAVEPRRSGRVRRSPARYLEGGNPTA